MKAATTFLISPLDAVKISIHAAREGGDLRTVFRLEHGNISIHAAREGGDAAFGQHVVCNRVFQSTPPVKAATIRYGY